MPIISQILCDGCQAVKKQANHWYTLAISDNHEARLRPMAMAPVELFQADAVGVQYLCGRRCVIGALDQWMDRFTAPPSQPFHGKASATRGEH
jgi:hypothetical protein